MDSIHQGIRTRLIMERICSLLSEKDLCSWYNATWFLWDNIDVICWRRHVKKLATALDENVDNDIKYHEQYHKLQGALKNRQRELKRSFHALPIIEDVTAASRLAFHNMPAETPAIQIVFPHPGSPDDHMRALAARASDSIRLIQVLPGEGLSNILEDINTSTLKIQYHGLPDEDYRALARYMDSQVCRVFLERLYWPLDDPNIFPLFEYDGKGKCHLIVLQGRSRDLDGVLNSKIILQHWCISANWRATMYVTLQSWDMCFKVMIRLKPCNPRPHLCSIVQLDLDS